MNISIQRPFLSFPHFYRRFILYVGFVLFFTHLKAQAPAIQWQKTLDVTKRESAKAIRQTTDGGYIAAGSSYTEATLTDALVIKLDNAGIVQWQKTFGGTGGDEATSIQQTADGGYIVAGLSSGGDAWVIKLDNTGTIQWQKTFDGVVEEFIYSIQQTADGGYIMAGKISIGQVDFFDVGYDVWVVKLDNTGVVQWQKAIRDYFLNLATAAAIQQTTDGGYIVLANYSFSTWTWIIKLDNTGLVQWQNTLNNDFHNGAASIQQTTDGGYILAGFVDSTPTDVWIVKLGNTGDIQWQKTLDKGAYEYSTSIQQTTDSGYIVAITSTNYDSGYSVTTFILKLDDTGDIQWQKTLDGYAAQSIQQTTDGGYITGGGASLVKLAPLCPFSPTISGNNRAYLGDTISLTGSATTGTFVWSSDNPSIATVSQTGVVTSVSMGTTKIRYAVTQSGCTQIVSKNIEVVFFDPAKCYRITNKTTGKVLAVKDASNLDSAQIYQWTFDGRMDKLWKIVKLADGKNNFVSVGSGKLMDIQDNTSAGFCTEGTIIQQFKADGTNSQKWRLEPQQTDASFKILNATCNKFLRVEGPSSADGANVGIKNDFGTDAFKWFIEETPCTAPIYSNQCYRIVNKATNKVLELKNGALTDSTQIYQWASATNRPQQLWQTTKLSDGKYIITSASSQKVIDVLDNTASGFCTEGTIIQQFPLDLTNSQRWGIIAQTDGSYKIVNTTCNKYLRVESGSTADGASVGIKNDFGSDAFKWYFQPADCSTGAVLSATNALFNFEARASEGRAKLQWLTNTGDKTDYFTVERLNPQGDFAILDRQNAYPTKDTKYYTFIDNDPLDGDNLYRINTVFNNAPPQYSEVKKVDFSKNDGVNIYPNPANDYISVDLRQYEGKTVSLYLYNAMGLMVKKQIIEKVSAVPQRIDIDEFITGSYLVRVQAEGKRDVLRQVTIAK